MSVIGGHALQCNANISHVFEMFAFFTVVSYAICNVLTCMQSMYMCGNAMEVGMWDWDSFNMHASEYTMIPIHL